MESLADNLCEQGGKHDEAEKLYREIWHIRERFLGASDPKTLESMHNLAAVLYQRGKPAEAETLHRETFDSRRRVLGENHPATRLSMAHLGMALLNQGKTEGAGPYIAELIELRRRAAHQRDATAKTLNEYAWLLLTCEPVELRDPETALSVAQEAARLSGRQDALLLDTLALAQKMTGDVHAAIETQKEAVALLSPADFKEWIGLQQTLSDYFKEAGDLAALEQWHRDNLAKTRSSFPAGSLPVAVSLRMLGEFLLEQERSTEAEAAFREVADIARAALPRNHWRLFEIESMVGRALAGQGRFEDAEALVVDGYLHMRDNTQVPADEVSRALTRVIDLYTAWQKPDEAAKFRAKGQTGTAVRAPP
jgi:tetratricopeptide (TPR) repeat protein